MSSTHSCRILTKLEILDKFSKRISNIKFHQNKSYGNRVVPDGQTNMKLIVAFRNFANAPKSEPFL
jgi:hypothetical protein